ncbi:MAG: phosphate/phosphite/phosphonate ABC transporter substrate-binding protein [Geminicoccaceae bacterium]
MLKKVMFAWLAAASLWPVHGAPAFAAESDDRLTSRTIVLGRVSNNPRKHYAALDALGRYLAEKSDKIDRHETLLASDNDEMIELLHAGKVDLVSESAFSAILYEQDADARILLRQWKGGRPNYKSLFFTRKDSDLHELMDLPGHLIAFEDVGSTSGYFVPKATIAAHGMTLRSAEQARSIGDVGYLFADSEVNIVAWVARGKVDAGVTSDVHWEDSSRAPPGLKKELRVFHATPEILRSVMIAGPALEGGLLQAVVDILLEMHEDDDGREVLANFYKTERFDRLVGDAKKSLDHIRTLYHRLGDAPPS